MNSQILSLDEGQSVHLRLPDSISRLCIQCETETSSSENIVPKRNMVTTLEPTLTGIMQVDRFAGRRPPYARITAKSPPAPQKQESSLDNYLEEQHTPIEPRNAYKVFVSYNSKDFKKVQPIVKRLREDKRIKLWLDIEQIPPGVLIQKRLQQAIRGSTCAAVFIGPSGIGRWQDIEVSSFIKRCVENGITVIPVLLPEVEEIPPELPFLSEFEEVRFENEDDKDALDHLIRGITDVKPATKT